jgi:hypothetical protein
MILYVRHNEETSRLKMVHFHSGDIPSEMEANAKSKHFSLHFCLRDSDSVVFQFWTRRFLKLPSIWCANNGLAQYLTSDVRQILIKGQFDPKNLAALSHHLNIPRALMFMSSPGPNFGYPVAELGARIISI